ncbi:MAG: hypothetical protein A2103_05005 [Gammaproteobacteria bacterium GWF2_41_13]|nr:MAG: hypothetical protein A2103_05005 [Gammaproteobacteria bacterium GWF2_41_13]
MDQYLTEEQQVELLKRLWKEYGLAVLTGVVLAVMIVFGWRFYQTYRTEQRQQASMIYEHMMVSLINHQYDEANNQAKILRSHFHRTPYGTIAALTTAKIAVDRGDLMMAVRMLRWASTHGQGDALRQTARIRLARIYLDQKKPNQALNILETVDDEAFMPLIDETKGDVYLQLGSTLQARMAYDRALTALPDTALNRPLLEMKLADLPAEDNQKN